MMQLQKLSFSEACKKNLGLLQIKLYKLTFYRNTINIYDVTAISIFFRRQAEKSLRLLQIKLQKLTFCRNAIYYLVKNR